MNFLKNDIINSWRLVKEINMSTIPGTNYSGIELFNKWGDMNGYKKKYPISNYKPEQGILSSRILDKPYLELQESNGQAERRID